MLLEGANPYRGGLPEVLELGWEDFTFQISAANLQAMGQRADWAVFAYLAADCNLAADIFDDLLEMKSTPSGPSMHVMALFDGPLVTDAFIARLNPGNSLADDVILRFTELKTSDQATLTMALRVASLYPAQRRLLLLGGHGQGWRGLMLDQNRGDVYQQDPANRMRLPASPQACVERLRSCQRRAEAELDAAFSAPGYEAPPRHDLLALDACYMGQIEAVARLTDHAEMLVVSQDQMPGQGFAYRELLQTLSADPSQSAQALATTLVADTTKWYREAEKPLEVKLTVLRSDGLAAFSDALVALVQALRPTPASSDDFVAFRDALERAWPFGPMDAVDLKGFLQQLSEAVLSPAVGELVRAAVARFDDMVVSFSAEGTPDTANGLSIYAPRPARFDPAYIRCSNELPVNLGIWAWQLGQYYLAALGEGAGDNVLVQALTETMQAQVRLGNWPPA